MPKKIAELGPQKIRDLSGVEGFHNVGGVAGLHLLVRGGAKSWILRTVVGGKRRDIGLGGFPDVSLTDAREQARQVRGQVARGFDPITERDKANAALAARKSFAEASRDLIRAKGPEWRNAKHRAQWASTLETYAFPIIGALPLDAVEVDHVLRVLGPIWLTKNETANRVRQRMEAVLDFAKAANLRSGDNPARWKGHLDKLLARPSKVRKVKHHRALPYDDLAAFLPELRKQEGTASRALEFLILTATRSGEVRFAKWSEIDVASATWVIPSGRMKAGKEHRVPLSKPALDILAALPRYAQLFQDAASDDYVFVAPSGNPFSDMALAAVLRRMKVDAVPHGFRACFRTWASECTNHPRDVAEMALAHTIKDAVERAYRRGDLFERRRNLMDDWAKFATTPRPDKTDNVTAVRGAA